MASNRSKTRSNTELGAWNDGLAAPALSAFLSAPGFALSQRLALEGARFWAKRVRACADQMEALAHCDDVAAMMQVQAEFLNQVQQDYLAEGEAIRAIVAAPSEPGDQQAARS